MISGTKSIGNGTAANAPLFANLNDYRDTKTMKFKYNPE
jgi:hypothetical protein